MRDALAGGAEREAALKAAAFDLHPEPKLVFDTEDRLLVANEAACDRLGHGSTLMARARLADCLAPGSGLPSLLERCRSTESWVRDRAARIEVLGQPAFEADALASPIGEGSVLLTLRARGSSLGADRPGDLSGMRSAAGLGRMLAHEIKNPLAGIRGAAQLLKAAASVGDVPLAQLIVDETDRVHRLVDRMEALSEGAPLRRQSVNIHRVLDRVRALTASSLAEEITLTEQYDPSLPPAWGDEDQLIQMFLNLVKNAAEAARERDDGRGEIVISTAYRHGMHTRTAPEEPLAEAPLEVRVADNGPGAPAAIRDHIFEPFVTTKPNGAGLGLALVSKVAAAHGGRVDFESQSGRTVFRVLLPVTPREMARTT
ncbi:MAG TPA: ATP-binding protein [Caulobacteraceae bacterium]|nr:ATP-binding protein [Caulobacteraceae bacterium]